MMPPKPTALRVAIALAITFSPVYAGAALAQDAQTLDAVSVTGSRISVPGVEASSPVASVEREEFLSTQPVAVESFLKEIPALTPSIGPGTNNGSGGGATINMRGLGDNRTLVLVDGRRPVPFNLANVVDTNTIPMALLQSVEMLTGGASVVYGADAVAGVTNFILRRDFEGVEVSSRWGQSSKGDAARENYEITFGALSDDGRANAVLSVGYTKVDPLRQGERPWGVDTWSSFTGRSDGSNTTTPARITIPGLGGVLGTTSNTGQVNEDGTELVTPYRQFNTTPLNYYQTGLDRWQTTAMARYEFSERVEAYGQVNYTRSKVEAQLAESGIFSQSFNVPLANPYIPAAMLQQICTARNISAAECASGRDASGELIRVPMTIARRLTELGPRASDFDTKVFQMTAGLRGALSDNWNYDSYWSYGESDRLRTRGNWGSLSKTRQALDAISTTECLDTSNGCVPLNPFGASGSITPEQAEFINLSSFNMEFVEQTNAAFNLDGNLGNFKSPWADYPIGIAAGVEYRRTVAGTRSDAASGTNAEVMGSGAASPDSRGGFTIQEAYAESIIPLVSGRTGVENLSLELGYRHTEFSNTGGFDDNYGSWKYGLTWTPVQSLKFRAMQQRATRAPNISELFQPEVTGLANGVDPCAEGNINMADAASPGTLSWLCVQTGVPAGMVGAVDPPSSGQVNVLRSGNLGLSPEEADTTTLGLVWTPNNQLSVTLDYWDIEVDRAITRLAVQDVLGGCYGAANTGYTLNEWCALASGRHTSNGSYNGADSRGISQPLSNAGFIHKTGYDLGVRLAHDMPGSLGRMQYALDLSKVTRDDFQATPTSVLRDCLGYYSTSCIPSHDLRSNMRATWTVRDVAVTMSWRYFSAIDIEPLAESTRRFFEPYRHIGSYSYFDLGVSYNAPWNAKLSLSVNNVFDKSPKVVGNNVGGTAENSGNIYPQWYDAIGRYVNLGVTFKF